MVFIFAALFSQNERGYGISRVDDVSIDAVGILLEKMERELKSDGKQVEMVVWQDWNENIFYLFLLEKIKL